MSPCWWETVEVRSGQVPLCTAVCGNASNYLTMSKLLCWLVDTRWMVHWGKEVLDTWPAVQCDFPCVFPH